MIARRAFFERVAGGMALVAPSLRLDVSYQQPDDFTRDGWRVQWHGWNHAINQCLETGFWTACKAGDDSGDFQYATTLGVYGKARRFEHLDMVRTAEWPVIDGTHDARTKELVKRAALAWLLEHLS